MNIVYLTTAFLPENKGDNIYTDLVEALISNHHKVIVIAIDQNAINKISTNNERGAIVHRIKVPKYYNVSYIKKGIASILYPYILKKRIRKLQITEKVDVILHDSPPVTNSSVVSYLKKALKSKSYLILKDIFPQNAVDLKMIKENTIVHRFFKKKEERLYAVSDFIGCMSEANMKHIIEHSAVNDKKVKYFPNTKKNTLVRYDMLDKNSLRKFYNLPENMILFLVGGNLGKPQYPELLYEMVKRFKDSDILGFVFIGRGSEKGKLLEYINSNKINNCFVFEEMKRNDFEQLASCTDAGLITLNPNFTIPNYPSRILSYMQVGLPIIAATDVNTDYRHLIQDHNFGFWCSSNNFDNLGRVLTDFCKLSKDERTIIGDMGHKYFIENFNVSISVKFLEEQLNHKA